MLWTNTASLRQQQEDHSEKGIGQIRDPEGAPHIKVSMLVALAPPTDDPIPDHRHFNAPYYPCVQLHCYFLRQVPYSGP